jgi:hypothetical protein
MVAELLPVARAKKRAKLSSTAENKIAAAKKVWQAKLRCEWKSIVEADKPPEGRVFVYDSKGMFKVSILGRGPKSFSWTCRGGSAAAACCLKWLWTTRIEILGGDMPPHLDLDDVEY